MRFVILIVIMVVAVAAGFLTLQLATSSKPQPGATSTNSANTQVVTTDVLVARMPIPIGTVIKDDMVDRQPWPQHLVLEGFITGDSPNANIVGMVTRTEMQAQEPFNTAKLARPNDSNYLAAGLSKGYRAVTIAVDTISGVAGYIFPGDRVDLLLTHGVPIRVMPTSKAISGSDKAIVSEVMVPNVKVIAVDIRNPLPADKRNNAAAKAPSNITLEVAAEDVQKIRLAEKNGTLSLALRSLKDKDELLVPPPAVLPVLTTVTLSDDEVNGGSGHVTIIRGIKSEEPTSPKNPLASLAQPETAATSEPAAPLPSGAAIPESESVPVSPNTVTTHESQQ